MLVSYVFSSAIQQHINYIEKQVLNGAAKGIKPVAVAEYISPHAIRALESKGYIVTDMTIDSTCYWIDWKLDTVETEIESQLEPLKMLKNGRETN
jgi:predicted GNAT superfamily acetyltransferase